MALELGEHQHVADFDERVPLLQEHTLVLSAGIDEVADETGETDQHLAVFEQLSMQQQE